VAPRRLFDLHRSPNDAMRGDHGASGPITLPGVLAALSDTTPLRLVRVLADGHERA
jgi:hypothetical protein